MKKLFAFLILTISFSSANASESKIKLDVASDSTAQSLSDPSVQERDVAQAQPDKVVPVERPESLKYESIDYKKHKEYLRYLDVHDRK